MAYGILFVCSQSFNQHAKHHMGVHLHVRVEVHRRLSNTSMRGAVKGMQFKVPSHFEM